MHCVFARESKNEPEFDVKIIRRVVHAENGKIAFVRSKPQTFVIKADYQSCISFIYFLHSSAIFF